MALSREPRNVILRHDLALPMRTLRHTLLACNAHSKPVVEDSPRYVFNQQLGYNCERRDWLSPPASTKCATTRRALSSTNISPLGQL